MNMKKIVIVFVLLFVLIGCQSATAVTPEPTTIAEVPTNTATSEPTATLEPTATATAVPTATNTPIPTETPEPEPTNTPRPANTPVKAKPTNTPKAEKPTPEPVGTAVSEATAVVNDDVTPIANTDELGDALEFIQDAESNAQKQDSMTMRQVVTTDASILQQIMEQTCNVIMPDQVYCQTTTTVVYGNGDPITNGNEVVQIGDQLWLREEGGEWVELSQDDLGLTDEAMGQIKLSQFMTDASWAGETTIDGRPVYALDFEMDVATYFTYLMGAEVGDTLPLDTALGGGTLWIGQDDMLVRKATIQMGFEIEGEALTVTTQAAYGDYNEPVDIPDPREELDDK